MRSFGGALFYFWGCGVEIYRVSFIGHRQIYEIRYVEDRIEHLAREFLRQKEYVEFYVGRNGDFDVSVASAVRRAQRGDGARNSSLILVLPYRVKDESYYRDFYDEVCLPIDPKTHFKAAITKRNEWIIDHSDLLVAFVERPSGGAYKALQYAEQRGTEIVNIAHDLT